MPIINAITRNNHWTLVLEVKPFQSSLEPFNKFSALLAKKICYLRLLSPLAGDFAALLD
jgi:hypothetical protein